MRFVDALLEGNARFRDGAWDGRDASLGAPPARRLAVVACMDARHNVGRVLGLDHGEALVLRNAGAIVDDGVLRSLVVAVHFLGVRHVAVMGHTRCGMVEIGHGRHDIAEQVAATARVPAGAGGPEFDAWLAGYRDVEENVRAGVERIRTHAFLPPDLEVAGLVYENESGRVRPVRGAPSELAAAEAPRRR